jgi:hypothetical protein
MKMGHHTLARSKEIGKMAMVYVIIRREIFMLVSGKMI